MNKLLSLVALLSLLGAAYAIPPVPTPFAGVDGVVTDKCSGLPVKGVKVKFSHSLMPWGWSDRTNSDGYYAIVPNEQGVGGLLCILGVLDFVVKKTGYERIEGVFNPTCGEIVTMNLEITPDGGCEPDGEQEPYCGDGTCGEGEDCKNCEEDCGKCEEKSCWNSGPTFVYGLKQFYSNAFYWKRYAENCGIEYEKCMPPQNVRYLCWWHRTYEM